MVRITVLTLLLSGCQLYGGLAVHDTSFDSEFKQERLIAQIGASQDITDNAEVYIEHLSQPTYQEDGAGLNLIGLRLTAEIN